MQHYVQLAAKDKARYEQEKLDNPVVVEEADPDTHEDAVSSNTCIYQLGVCVFVCLVRLSCECGTNESCLLLCMWMTGRVKKIIQTDPDIDRVSREALIAIAKASVRALVF